MANDELPPPPTPTVTGKEIAAPSNSTDPSKVNISNPYFTHHSDHPGLILISKPLNGDNYSTWKRAMTLALNSKNKLGFVNGSIKASSEESDPEGYATWSRCNDMIHSWIVNTLSPEISDSVIYYSAAHEVWEDLRERFSQSNAPHIFEIQRDIAYLRQEQFSVSAYYTKLKGLWDELASYNDATHGAQHDQQKLMQFLMGLNDSYSAIRGQILLMNPLPSVRQAYSSVSQEEKQRLLSITTAAIDSGSSAAMAVRSNNRSRQKISVWDVKTSVDQGQAEVVLIAPTVERWVTGSKLAMNSMVIQRAIQRQNIIQAQNVSITVISMHQIMCLSPLSKWTENM